MIVSASRRTDIPARYGEWFFNRIREGFVLVRNPYNFRQVSRIALTPDAVDGIVFWTKNPLPLLPRLEELAPYPWYVQFTLTAYGADVEPDLPSKERILVPVFQRLAKEAGRDRLVWRYDPIFLGGRYTEEYHCRRFRQLAEQLAGSTDTCVVSFLDWYRNTERNMGELAPRVPDGNGQERLLARLEKIAAECGITLAACAETHDFRAVGVGRAHCIDAGRLERIGGVRLSAKKDPNQRAECGCAAAVDIGTYGTCPNGCRYCYANADGAAARRAAGRHDPASPLLIGQLQEGDVVTERKMPALADRQLSLFDC